MSSEHMNIIARLQSAMHMESNALSPKTSFAIETMRAAIEEIEKRDELIKRQGEMLVHLEECLIEGLKSHGDTGMT
jgi:hypothetical protein